MENLLQARSGVDNDVSKLNVANAFTVLRIPLCIFGIWLYGISPLWGMVAIVLAALTDFFDGYVARRFNCVTEFGRKLDPAVDKVFMAIVLIFALVTTGAWGGALILWAIVGIELLIAATSLAVWKHIGHAPTVVKVGKYGMFGRMIAVTAMLLTPTMLDVPLEATLGVALFTGGAGVGLGFLACLEYIDQAKHPFMYA